MVGPGPTDARSPVGTWAHYKDWTVVQRVAHLGTESSGEVAFSAGLVRHARTRRHPSLQLAAPSTLFHPPAVHIIPTFPLHLRTSDPHAV